MTEPTTLIQTGAIIGASWWLLKIMVADKLKQITTALGSHEKRIRQQEQTLAYLRGKGCLGGDSCVRISDNEEES